MRSSRQIVQTYRRGLAAQAAGKVQQTEASLSKQEAKISQLPNGATVASLENNSPISRVSVVFNAGSRFEGGHNLGVTHCIRNAAASSTKDISGFKLTRIINQAGAALSCTTSRDHLTYSVECTRNHLENSLDILKSVCSGHTFKPWEVEGVQESLKIDAAVFKQNPHLQMLELLHEVAFRNGLNKSLYAPDFMIGHYSPEMLQEFVSANLTAGRMTVTGVGMEHDQLMEYANKIQLAAGKGAAIEKTKYVGGERRVETGSPLTYVGVVTQGAAADSKDALAFSLLQTAMGHGPYVKYGSNTATSPVNSAAAGATADPVSASCFNVSYSDAGLFGFTVAGFSDSMDKVLKAVADKIKSVASSGLNDKDFQRAKTQLKANVLMHMENSDNLFEDLSIQTATLGNYTSVDATIQAIDNLSLNDVNAAAKKVLSTKPSMAAVGDLSKTPHIDELF